MTGGTTSTHGHTTHLTASEAHGTGADIGVRSGACRHGVTAGMTLGSTAGATRGITEDIGADGMTRGITGDTGDGMTHGTDICTHTTAVGTEAGIHTGTTIIMSSILHQGMYKEEKYTEDPV